MDPRNAERLIPVFNEFYGMGVQDTGSFYKEWTKLESLIKYDGAESISSMIHSAKRLDAIHTSYLTLEDGYMIAVSTENDKRILPVHIA